MSSVRNNNGFTLIELSMVLVIIALIVGGILFGRELIRSSEIRGTLSDLEKYSAAANTFRSKYNCLPGDCPRATSFWAAESTCPNTTYTATPHTETCDGNGDGMVGTAILPPGTSNMYETFRFWQHLANAELIPYKFNGISGTGSLTYQYALIGINVPASKIKGAGIAIYNLKDGSTNFPASYFPTTLVNVYVLGKQSTSGTTYFPAITGHEALSIDQKIDDGRPAFGNVITYIDLNCLSSATASLAAYITSDSQIRCSLYIKTGF